MMLSPFFLVFFFFNDTATTEIYTLSLHDALPIYAVEVVVVQRGAHHAVERAVDLPVARAQRHHAALLVHDLADRKSTRLNSSHSQISYAVFCLKKKKIPYPTSARYPTSAAIARCM